MSNPTPSTVRTRILLLSDTHNYSPTSTSTLPPLPPADLLLHAGDLTMIGGASNYRTLIAWLSSCAAPLKIIIAGNHDIDLDPDYYRRLHGAESSAEAEREIEQARAVWKGEEARRAGVVYLEEGFAGFSLRNGARFTIYTSPHTPEFCNWAFPYPRSVDRFNPPSSSSSSSSSTSSSSSSSSSSSPKNPLPSFPNVDLVLTHGPPHSILDTTTHGDQAGCVHLRTAVQRARPRLHVFGHIHEGWGVERWRWGGAGGKGQGGGKVEPGHEGGKVEKGQEGGVEEGEANEEDRKVDVDVKVDEDTGCMILDLTPQSDGQGGLEWGKETVFVNAAVRDVRYRPVNRPWVVDLELPRR